MGTSLRRPEKGVDHGVDHVLREGQRKGWASLTGRPEEGVVVVVVVVGGGICRLHHTRGPEKGGREHQKKRMGSLAAVLDQSQILYSRFQHDTVLSQLIKLAELSVSCWSRVGDRCGIDRLVIISVD